MPAIKFSERNKTLQGSPIPITLLSGFLGSGKTTLLENILKTEHGLKIAVIINDVSQLNIDAALIQNHNVTKKQEKLIQLQNGCICCTLRGDLLEELVELSTKGEFQYIIIESTGISEPMQVAETFTTEFTEMLLQSQGTIPVEEEKVLKSIVDLGGLAKLTKLDTCVTVIDSKHFLADFETTDFLVDRYGDNGQGEGERTITDLMVDQIEFADVIILNKISTINKKKQAKILKIIKSLNPIAKVLKSDYSKIDVNEVVNTNMFDFEKASSSAGWLQSINEMTLREGFGTKDKLALTPKPETEEYGINNFIYRNRKPFHPERLYKMVRDKFVIIEQSGVAGEEGGEEEGDNSGEESDNLSEILASDEESDTEESQFDSLTEKQLIKNKKSSPFGPLLRSKGFFWLASRHIIRGEWSSAGSMLTLKGGIPWFAVTGPDYFPPEAAELIARDMEGKYGDRRNDLVFIGLKINKKELTKALDSCILTDEEFKEYEEAIDNETNLFKIEKKLQQTFDDGFESWIEFDENEEEEEGAEKQENEDVDPVESSEQSNLKSKSVKSTLQPNSTKEPEIQINTKKHGSHVHVSAVKI